MNYTTEDLYEQAKLVLRGNLDDDVTGQENFILVCSFCGLAFPNQAEQGMVLQHMELSHPESLTEDEEGTAHIQLSLVWIGEGPPPEPQR